VEEDKGFNDCHYHVLPYTIGVACSYPMKLHNLRAMLALSTRLKLAQAIVTQDEATR
jgi:hypothetical protein